MSLRHVVVFVSSIASFTFTVTSSSSASANMAVSFVELDDAGVCRDLPAKNTMSTGSVSSFLIASSATSLEARFSGVCSATGTLSQDDWNVRLRGGSECSALLINCCTVTGDMRLRSFSARLESLVM